MAGDLKVAAVQLQPTDDGQRNLAQALDLAGRAADEGARLVALPEYFSWYGPRESWVRWAREETPRIKEAARELAADKGIHLLLGSVPESAADPAKVENRSIVYGQAGEEVGGYTKVHLFDVDTPDIRYRESDILVPGDRLVVVEIEGWQVGLSICFDLRFPGHYRELRRRGAELFCVPAAFTLHTGRDHWEVLLRARALENQCGLVAPALTGECQGKSCYGRSLIIDPWGVVRAGAGDAVGFIQAELSRRQLEEIRAAMPLADVAGEEG